MTRRKWFMLSAWVLVWLIATGNMHGADWRSGYVFSWTIVWLAVGYVARGKE